MKLNHWFSTFQQSIFRSVTDLNYYVEVLNLPLRFSLKILTAFYLILGVVLTFIFLVKDLPKIDKTFNDIRTEAITRYPADLTFAWQEPLLSSSLTQPLEVPFPAAIEHRENMPKNLAVIDTHTDQFPGQVNAMLFINKEKFFLNSLDGTWTDVPLDQVFEQSSDQLDRQKFVQLAKSSIGFQKEFLRILPWAVLLSSTIGLFILRLLTMLFFSVFLQLFFQLLNKPLSYKKVFQICLHILIPTEIIHQITVLYPHISISLFNLSFWMITAVVLWHLRHLQILKFELDGSNQENQQ